MSNDGSHGESVLAKQEGSDSLVVVCGGVPRQKTPNCNIGIERGRREKREIAHELLTTYAS